MIHSLSESLFKEAVGWHTAGQITRAQEAYETVLRQNPGHAGAWHLSGVIQHQQRSHQEAVRRIRKAIEIDATQAPFFNNLGVALLEMGQAADAIACFQSALYLRPNYADALANAGIALEQIGQIGEARNRYEKAAELEPANVTVWGRLLAFYQATGRGVDAVALIEKALEHLPHSPEVFNTAGVVYLGQDMTEEATDCFTKAANLKPEQWTWQLRLAAVCSQVFFSSQEMDRYRESLVTTLDQVAGSAPSVPFSPVSGCMPSYNLAHHGRNDRPIRERFGKIIARHVTPLTPLKNAGKPRIGFLVTGHHEGIFLRCMAGIIEKLDPTCFQPVLLCTNAGRKFLERGFVRKDIEWVTFADRLPLAIEQIRAAQCDVLNYWEVGTDLLNYMLPFYRLAPVQCTSFGTPTTTGIPTMDYYLSSELTEPDDADSHYTEKLWRFNTLPPYQFYPPRPEAVRRSEFGLPDDKHLYVCPQRLLKMHPDFDAALLGILQSDAQGLIVLLEGNPRTMKRLQERFGQSLGTHADRVVFVPRQSSLNFLRLLSLADVVLDTFHYGAGSTCYDIFSLDLPMVTLPGEFNIGRFTLGCLHKMGMNELVATSVEHYVELTTGFATDRDLQVATRKRIAERATVLFEDIEAVRAHEEFFSEVMKAHRRLP